MGDKLVAGITEVSRVRGFLGLPKKHVRVLFCVSRTFLDVSESLRKIYSELYDESATDVIEEEMNHLAKTMDATDLVIEKRYGE